MAPIVPKVSKIVAYVVAFVNLILTLSDYILPGFGTLIAAFAATSQTAVSKTQLAIGGLQFFTSFVLIGWAWSIYWGYLRVMKAMD